MPCDREKSKVGTKHSDHQYIYDLVQRHKCKANLLYSTCLSPSLLRLSKDKLRLSEMEHFGDLEERTSISIDENEIPISDSEDDYSFSSSVFEEFGIFKSNGLTRIEKGSKCYEIINGCVAHGDGLKDKKVAAVHKIPWSGPNGQLEAFRVSSAEMVNKRGSRKWKYKARMVLLLSFLVGPNRREIDGEMYRGLLECGCGKWSLVPCRVSGLLWKQTMKWMEYGRRVIKRTLLNFKVEEQPIEIIE